MSDGDIFPGTVTCKACGDEMPASESCITTSEHPLGVYEIVCEGCSLNE